MRPGIAPGAESESVQLRARQAILQHLLKVSDYVNLERRVAEMEEEVRVRKGNAGYPA